jgi:3-phenylpropionate/trans-cinnamate dioxygenase ferredoxin component
MAEFQTVGSLDEFADPSSTFVEVDERPIVLIRAAGRVYALDDVCTHDGGPLSDGDVDPEDRSIACPRHGAKFSAESGAAMTMPATKPTIAHEVRVEGNQVFVKLNDQ